MRLLCSSILISAILLTFGCSQLNDNPPEYIKEFVVYKEGQGLMIYLILADESGAMTTSDGGVILTISYTAYNKEIVLKEIYRKVKKSDFQKAKVGLGPFQREVILYPIGRIPYDGSLVGKWGKARIEFITYNRILESVEEFVF